MNIKKMTMKVLSLVMVLAMLLGICAPTVMAAPGKYSAPATEENKELNYVSIGDSMANGYGFEGYEQCNKTNAAYDFQNGVGVYGEGAYPLQFEAYLESLGYDVNHTKLALSALLADDLLYLLGAREEEFDDEWNGYRDYDGQYTDMENKVFFQNAVENADVITLGTGNASFGAFLVDRITNTIGIMGDEGKVYETLTLENGLALLESEEAKEIVLEVYAELEAELLSYVGELDFELNVEACLDVVAYTVASFLVSYEAVVDRIVELNPDVEIILVGLMNTTYGMHITGEGFDISFGDIMGNVFGAVNAYIAGLPAAKQLAGEYEDASFYYAEQPEPKFICQAFDDLYEANWQNIQDGRLSGDVVRDRNIDAYNDALRYAISAALGMDLPKIDLDDVANYTFAADDTYNIGNEFAAQAQAYGEDYAADGAVDVNEYPLVKKYVDATGDSFIQNPGSNVPEVFADDIEKEISIAIYLAIEEAVVANVDTMNIPVGGLVGIATDIFGALGEMPEALTENPGPNTIKTELVKWFTGSDNGNAMCKIYALFKVGNGMSVHPTPEGHDDIAKSVIDAYVAGHTAQDETIANITFVLETIADLVVEYYDEAYAYGYEKAVEYGVIDAINEYLTEADKALDEVVAWAEANADEAHAAAVKASVAATKAVIAELKALV
ncbi:MAG: hypothetical protein IJW03_05550, partial [Clostridia bacterium]|nr:hypothetical protein [Clostridia bacterium]